MNCRDVYAALQALESGQPVDLDDTAIAYFQDKWLIEITSPETYAQLHEVAQRFAALQEQHQKQTDARHRAGSAIPCRDLRPSGMFARMRGEDTAFDTRMSAAMAQYKQEQDKLELVTAEFEQVKTAKAVIDGQVRVNGYYLKPSSLGKTRRVELHTRLYRVADRSYEDFRAEQGAVAEQLEARVARYEALMVAATKYQRTFGVFDVDRWDFRKAMAVLSDRKTPFLRFCEMYASLKSISDHWTGRQSYADIAALASLPERVEDIMCRVYEAWRKLDHQSPGDTFGRMNAAVELTVQGGDIDQRVRRLSDIRQLTTTFYPSRSGEYDSAAILTDTKGDGIALLWSGMIGKLTKAAPDDPLSWGMLQAAAILVRAIPPDESSQEQAATRWRTLHDRLKVNPSPDCTPSYTTYPDIARLALSPVSIDETCELFDAVAARIGDKKIGMDGKESELHRFDRIMLASYFLDSAWDVLTSPAKASEPAAQPTGQ